MSIIIKAFHQIVHLVGEEGMLHDLVFPLCKLLLGWEVTINQQIGDLKE